jgi:hypothetical protein
VGCVLAPRDAIEAGSPSALLETGEEDFYASLGVALDPADVLPGKGSGTRFAVTVSDVRKGS